jgi:hypothetical protein
VARRIGLGFGADCQRAGIFHSRDEGAGAAAAPIGALGMSAAFTCGCPGGICSPAAPGAAPFVGGCPGGSGSSLSAIGLDVGIAAGGEDDGGSDPMALPVGDVDRPSANAAAEEMATIPNTLVRLKRTRVM